MSSKGKYYKYQNLVCVIRDEFEVLFAQVGYLIVIEDLGSNTQKSALGYTYLLCV